MVFGSITFLCVFMPVVFTAYYLCPVKLRNFMLLIASLFFYAWGEPVYILVMLFSTIFNYFAGRLISAYMENIYLKRMFLIIPLIINLGILFFFKYTDFFIQTLNEAGFNNLTPIGTALPIGISFYTFQTISYVVDVYRQNVNAQENIIDFAMYVCMFPQLIAGPVVRYGQIEGQIHNRKLSDKTIAPGLQRFITGLGKKVIFADQAGALWNDIYNTGSPDMSMSLAWLGAVAYTLQIYFDFSGYSDMAIGMGKMLGFDFPENFNYPYKSASITEFWRRWHITLSTWFKEYVYIPLGGSRKGTARQTFNLFIVWTLTGLWHGAAWNFVIWGIYFFVLLFLEKLFLLDLLEKLPGFIRHLYALFFIVIGWVIFACGNFQSLAGYIKALAGNGIPLYNSISIYKIYTNIILLLIMAAASTGLPVRILKKINIKIRLFAAPVFSVIVLLLSMALLVSGSYTPFLYFRF